MEEIEKALQDYKDGKHVHLGHPDDCLKSPEELEEQRRIERGIIDAVYAYEIEKGGIKVVNGLFEYDPEVLARLPKYRDNETINCCLEH